MNAESEELNAFLSSFLQSLVIVRRRENDCLVEVNVDKIVTSLLTMVYDTP